MTRSYHPLNAANLISHKSDEAIFQGKENKTIICERGGQTFTVKGQIVNILGFVGHKSSLATTHSAIIMQKQP